MTPPPALLRQLRDGVAAVQAKDFAAARTLLQPVAEAFPGDARPWFWLAVASPSADAAVPCLRRVLSIDASHPQARAALAKLLLTQAATLLKGAGRDAALPLVTEATSLTPDSDRVWVALAVVTDDGATRLEALRRAHALAPLPATRTHLLRAMLDRATAVSASQRADARALYHEVLEFDPGDLRAWHGLLQLADSTTAALDTVRGLVRNAPEQTGGRVFLKQALKADARVLEVEGRSQEACSRWREALGLDEYDVDAWLGLAQSTGDEDEAHRAITTAFDIAPTDARVSSAMARMHEATFATAAYDIPSDAFAHLDASPRRRRGSVRAVRATRHVDPGEPEGARGDGSGAARARRRPPGGRHAAANRDDRRRQPDHPEDPRPDARARRLQGGRRTGW